MVICLERGADLHMPQLMPLPPTVSCFSQIQIGFIFLVPAHLGSPGKRAVKCVCVVTDQRFPQQTWCRGRGSFKNVILSFTQQQFQTRMHSIMVFQSRQTINRMTVAARVLFLASPNMCTVVLKQKCETTVSMADSYQPGVQLNTSRKPGRNCHNRSKLARCDKSSETQQS